MPDNRSILYIQYANPACYPSLERSSRILADAGWKVFFIGKESFGESGILNIEPHRNISIKKLSYRGGGASQKFHYLWFLILCLIRTILRRPGWVYASDILSCPVTLFLSCIPGTEIIYHEHDSPDLSHPSIFMKYALWSRKKISKKAALCILPNENRKKNFQSETGALDRVLNVMNCPMKEDAAQPKTYFNKNGLSVVYHGSIVPSKLPRSVLEAMAILPGSIALKVIGYETIGHEGYIEELKRLSIRLGISGRVEYCGAEDRTDLLRSCRQYDVGLSFISGKSDDINERNMTGASNKTFEYMACGLALLVSDLPDWRRMYVDPGYALACDPDDPGSIAEALKRFLNNPQEMRYMGERGRQKIMSEWNYERQFEPVFNRLNKA